MWGWQAALAPPSSQPSPFCPQSSRRTVAADLVRYRAQRGGLGPTFADRGLSLLSSVPEAAWSPSLQTESSCPSPLPCKDCPALGGAKWGLWGMLSLL